MRVFNLHHKKIGKINISRKIISKEENKTTRLPLVDISAPGTDVKKLTSATITISSWILLRLRLIAAKKSESKNNKAADLSLRPWYKNKGFIFLLPDPHKQKVSRDNVKSQRLMFKCETVVRHKNIRIRY
ncbi:MAG TPA: hypothetical protein VL995_05740 [Cellvibrio sp.]|nr:hypothetical protein [Cellvibrio sp.]